MSSSGDHSVEGQQSELDWQCVHLATEYQGACLCSLVALVFGILLGKEQIQDYLSKPAS